VLWDHPFLTAALAIIVLTTATLVAFTILPRYAPIGPELLRNASFAEGLDGWQVDRDSGSVAVREGMAVLRNEVPGGFVGLSQKIPLHVAPSAFLFSATVASDDLRRGREPAHTGRVQLIAQGPSDGVDRKRHLLVQVLGTQRWNTYSTTISLDDGVASIAAHVQIREATGILSVRDVSLMPLVERPSALVMSSIILVGWVLCYGWIGLNVLRILRTGAAKAFAAVGLVVLVGGMFAPNEVKHHVLGTVESALLVALIDPAFLAAEALGIELRDPGLMRLMVLDGLWHSLAFAVLTLAALRIRPDDGLLHQIVWLSIFAGGTEVVQFYAVDRLPSYLDLAFDIAAILSVHMIAAMVRRRRRES
jgi:hypothetical protein